MGYPDPGIESQVPPTGLETVGEATALTVLSPDRDLAVANLTRRVNHAEAIGKVDGEKIELLKLQLLLARTIDSGEGYDKEASDKAKAAAEDYRRRHPDAAGRISVEVVRHGYANDERWRLSGFDPDRFKPDSIYRRQEVELYWERAARAEQERFEASKRAQFNSALANKALESFRAAQDTNN